MSTNNTAEIAAEIVRRPAQEWLTEQYLPFSLYVIRSRALVAEDGLKPVNRRVLYSLFKNGIHPTSKHLKAARAAADTVAYHPHGSSSIEDALARMAQWFNMRVPLIDKYGAVGDVTGDKPAAARYWECRLSKAAMELVKELPAGAVPIGKNFDGELDEPRLLPIRWPTGIINGTEGIAVGYASKIYPHNPDEVMKAAIALLKDEDLTVEKLIKIMPGPDFPTGGELFEVDGVKEYYETGNGKFTVRARYRVEQMSMGRTRFVFYELPFQVSPESVIQKISDIKKSGGMTEISAVKELSDMKNGVRFIVETKAGTNQLAVLNDLFKKTALEQSFSVNNTVLINNTPRQVSMIDMLRGFIDLRRGCVLNKAKARQAKIDKRLHQLNALLAALVDIDKCVSIIRNADSPEEARTALMGEFKIDEEQADYILSMQLRRLTKADSLQIAQEVAELNTEKAENSALIADPAKIDVVVEAELRETLKVISDPRRTVISGMTKDDLKTRQQNAAKAARESTKNTSCFITRFESGTLLRTTEKFEYKKNPRKLEHGPIREQISVMSKDFFVVATSDGAGYRVPVSYLMEDNATDPSSFGVQTSDSVKVVAIGRYSPKKGDIGMVLATREGDVKITKPEFPNKDEFPVYSLADGDEIVSGRWLDSSIATGKFVSVTAQGNALVYTVDKIRPSGAAAGGVKSHKLLADDAVVGFDVAPAASDVPFLVVSQGTHSLKMTMLSDLPPKGRGAQGVALHKFRNGESRLRQAAVTNAPAICAAGISNVLSLPPVTRRATGGVNLSIDVDFGSTAVEPR